MPGRRQGRGPDREVALAQYRHRAAIYDFELWFFEPVRSRAIELLQLQPGQHVLDVGCGTGLSFAPLERRIGRSGAITGIEQSPEMMARARERLRTYRWRNVELVEAPAGSAHLQGPADAALFHFTHDILIEDAALDHVFAHLRPGARVVASGLQWAAPWAWPVNGFVLMAALYSVSSLEDLERPWRRLEVRLKDFNVERALLGGGYVASGSV